MKISDFFKKLCSKDSVEVMEDGIPKIVEDIVEMASGKMEEGGVKLSKDILTIIAAEDRIIFEQDKVIAVGDVAKILPSAIAVH